MKKVGKTSRPFMYDLNQSGSNKQIKGFDLIDRVPNELWMEVRDIVQETGIKTISKKNKCKKAKWLSEETLEITKKEEKLKAKEKMKDIPS